jgi:hypothetical protein
MRRVGKLSRERNVRHQISYYHSLRHPELGAGQSRVAIEPSFKASSTLLASSAASAMKPVAADYGMTTSA